MLDVSQKNIAKSPEDVDKIEGELRSRSII